MFAQVNGIKLFYIKKGRGAPFLLLHGNSGSHSDFNSLTDKLCQNYTVYALDSRCHGQSSMTGEINYDTMAEDVASFITILGLERPVLLGASDGAITGLLLAMKYPEMLSKLITCGANTNPGQLKKWFIKLVKFGYMVTKDPKLQMMFTQPAISNDELSLIKIPTLLLAGNRDILSTEDTIKIADAIPGSRAFIFSGEGHSSYLKRSDKIYSVIQTFL